MKRNRLKYSQTTSKQFFTRQQHRYQMFHVKHAIKKIKNRMSSGNDEIYREFIKQNYLLQRELKDMELYRVI